MSVKLRLTRMGRKKRPFYRIVAADSRAPRDGKNLEKIGSYNPLTKPAEVHIDKALALKWLQNGAIPTPTVRNLLSQQGILMELDMIRRGLSPEQVDMEYKKREAVEIERRRKEEAVAAMNKRDSEKKSEAAKVKVKEAAEPISASEEVETPESADEAPAQS